MAEATKRKGKTSRSRPVARKRTRSTATSAGLKVGTEAERDGPPQELEAAITHDEPVAAAPPQELEAANSQDDPVAAAPEPPAEETRPVQGTDGPEATTSPEPSEGMGLVELAMTMPTFRKRVIARLVKKLG